MPFMPPRKDAREEYKKKLVARFSPHNAVVSAAAENAANEAKAVATKLRGTASALPPTETKNKTLLEQAALALDEAVKAAEKVRETYAALADTEQAVEYAQRYTDLQVGKSAGLLAFNGLGVAVALILWSSRELSPVLTFLLGLSLLISSFLALYASWSNWGEADKYETPEKDLDALLGITARRGMAMNIAILLGALSALMIGYGVWASDEKDMAVKINGVANELPVTIRSTAPDLTVNVRSNSSLPIKFNLSCVTQPVQNAAKKKNAKKNAPSKVECVTTN